MENVFVFGAPRSGTTYLSSALGALRDTEVVDGKLVPIGTCHLAGKEVPEDVYNALCVSVERNIYIYLSSDYNSRFRALEDWFRAPFQWERLRDVVRSGARAWPSRFVHKEPFFSLAPELVLDAIPEAKIIYIYRDGRDVANSLVQSYDVLTDQELTHLRSAEMRLGRVYDERYVPWWVEEGHDEEFIISPPYVRAIWMWAYMVRRCHRFFQELGEDSRVLRVEYEHFMRHPKAVGIQIREHLSADDPWAFRRHLNRARTTSIGKHKQRAQEEVDAAVEVAGDELAMLDYR